MFRIARMPDGEPVFEKYAVKVNAEAAVLHCARVSKMPYDTVWPGCQRPLNQTEIASFLHIEADEPLHIEVTYDHEPDEVIVRPLSKSVKASLDGSTVRLTITQPGGYTVEADGHHQALHLFVDPPMDFGVCELDENVLYFGPGVHRPGLVMLKSGQTAYIDRDAVVYGSFAALDCENVRVCGYGIIDGSNEKRVTGDDVYMTDEERRLPDMNAAQLLGWHSRQRVLWGGIRFWNCRSVRAEGCIIRDTATFAVIPGGCDGVRIAGIKTIGMWRYNSDGIDLINSRNVHIADCFTRNFDDCIVIKGIMGYDTLSNENILVENCTVWCDWGRALELGAETCAPEYRNIVFRNCDLIHGADVYMDIQHVNHARIRDVLFENICLEYSRHHLQPVYQRDMDAPYPNPQPAKQPIAAGIYIHNIPDLFCTAGYKNGSVENVEFKDIKMFVDEGIAQPEIVIKGLDEENCVQNVAFRNLTVNDRRIYSMEEANINIYDTVKDIVVE